MTLSNYNSNENADFNSGEMILSNYDFNETANYEPSESEDIYILIPDITSMICDHIIMKFYYRKYILKKKKYPFLHVKTPAALSMRQFNALFLHSLAPAVTAIKTPHSSRN